MFPNKQLTVQVNSKATKINVQHLFNAFLPDVPFLYLLKTSENLKVFGCFHVFRVLRKDALGTNRLRVTLVEAYI